MQTTLTFNSPSSINTKPSYGCRRFYDDASFLPNPLQGLKKAGNFAVNTKLIFDEKAVGNLKFCELFTNKVLLNTLTTPFKYNQSNHVVSPKNNRTNDYISFIMNKKFISLDNLSESLIDVINSRYAETLTTEGECVEFNHCRAFFDVKYDKIRFAFKNGAVVNLSVNAEGKVYGFYDYSHDLIKIIAAGIIRTGFAEKLVVVLEKIEVDKTAALANVVTSDDKLKLLNGILKKTRYFFKGSRFKSSNKIKTNDDIKVRWDEHIETIRLLGLCREYPNTGFLEEYIKFSVDHQVGNCGEMARITYAFCESYHLCPEFISFEKNKYSNHVACGVKINNEYYILDPWANIICKEINFISALKNKIAAWNKSGKFILNGEAGTIHMSQNSITPVDLLMTPEDISKFKLVRKMKLNLGRQVVGSAFINYLEDKLKNKGFDKKAAG
ncbi:transglutaminase-like domain-containing protein [Sodalis sp. RH23]|uniref:transglutaminase-like domain-containing protein n=1 Tax=unclassified Sodalis (in: enterobacteria) TaxID=2636512 RepID=UPI0039B3AA43